MRRPETPATERQVNYISALAEQLKDLLAEGTDLAKRVRDAAGSSLDKKTASDLIEVLLQAITSHQEGGSVPPDPEEITPLMGELRSVTAMQRDVADEKRQQAQEVRDRYNEHEMILMDGKEERPPPETFTKYIKVWKKYPNRTSGKYYNPIEYGWRWKCAHPGHLRYPAQGGYKNLGFQATVEAAHRHAMKFHAEEDICSEDEEQGS